MSLFEQLNPEQHQAVTLLPTQHALVLAGAGSGKTKVLTTRMAWLMQYAHFSPFELLAVTFTNKAAKEMQTRISALLPINTKGMWIGTFHGLCHRLLRTHYRAANLPQTFQILDMSDQLSLIKRLYKALAINDEQYPPKELQQFINQAKERAQRPHDIAIYDNKTRFYTDCYQQYQDQCQREGVVDFAELLLRCYEVLQNNVEVREHYQSRFRAVLVDEFQDTNVLQYKWLKLLVGTRASLFAVGDDDQSIYAFRGANVGNMKAFQDEFPSHQLIRLEQNYRSHGNILDAANALIELNSQRLGKNLWTQAGQGEPIRVYASDVDQSEAQWVVDEIKAQINEGTDPHEIAILYRSNAQSRVLEHALFTAGVPYKVYGGLRFFERQEVKHALAYLRLMENPHDDTAWMRVANFPTRGIGGRTLEQLADEARQQGQSMYASVGALSGRSGTVLLVFVRLLEQMRFEVQGLALPELVDKVIQLSGLYTHYESDKNEADRLDNLQELIHAATAFCIAEGYVIQGAENVDIADRPSALSAFLTHACLEAGDNQAQTGEHAVQLMTVHAAKGLEFDSVFITGLEENLFPHENSLFEADGVEEERRLMYVAITRARRRLQLTFSYSRMLHGQVRYHTQSRFLDELPEATLKWLTPKSRAVAAWEDDYRYQQRATHSLSGTSLTGRTTNIVGSREAQGMQVGDQWYKIGSTVTHPRFGEGVVLSLEGQGVEAMADINFKTAGKKSMLLAVAKMTVVG